MLRDRLSETRYFHCLDGKPGLNRYGQLDTERFAVDVSLWFIAVFALVWAAGPLTQVLFLIAPELHHRLGLTEANALKPEFHWYLLEERAIAYADLICVACGLTFLVLALLNKPSAVIFGLYNCACYVYVASISIPRWLLLGHHDLSPLPREQLIGYFTYMALYLLFGLYGLGYLWRLTRLQFQ